MLIKWYGHSCFVLTNDEGTRVLMDPPSPETGYDIDPISAEIVTVSHEHSDHNYTQLCCGSDKGETVYIRDAGVHENYGVRITGIPAFHDDKHGANRGNNMIYVVEMDGIRVVHVGDLGHLLDAETISKIGETDVLLAPIGGVYTITGKQALELANSLNANILIPMHYRTCDVKYKELDELMPFLNMARDCSVHRLRQSEATITRENLGTARLIALYHDRKIDDDE